MTDFSKLLNPEQFAAATVGEGPVLCLAAAGTGKTRTLVHRVAYLIEQGVPAERIILLTFTNRAAREMLERAQKLCGDAVSSIWSGTFHSICARILRRWGSSLGYQPGFRILDEDDQKKLVGELIKENVADPKDFPKKELVAKMFSEAMNEEKPILLIASRWMTKTAGVVPEAIEKLFRLYGARKRELGAMDFDDLLVKGLELLQTNEAVREMLQENFLHVLVDEYQDTNSLQAKFTDLLAAKHRNIMAVGDDFQCIYTWRGAQIENILDFPKRWPGCRVIKLERNYRSVPGVLEAANAVMKDAPGGFDKRLKPIRQGGILPRLYRAHDGRSQANEIVRIIREARAGGCAYRQIAVLYRSHFQSIEIQMTLAREQIPFKITSGVGVFEQVHVKDTLAYLRLLLNAEDELSFLRVATLLPGVGDKSAAGCWRKLGRRFDAKGEADRARFLELAPAKAKGSLKLLLKCMDAAYDHLANEDVGEALSDFCDLFYEDYLAGEYDEKEAEDRLEDVKELANQIANSGKDLAGFLSDVALMTNLDDRRNDPSVDRINLSTVHQAKGMEWPVVIVPWCCDGLFPSGKAAEEGRIDEERRLFYVAMTRAKDSLSMFVPSMRKMADGGMFPVSPSPFVRDIPGSLVDIRQAAFVPDPPSRFGGYGRRW